MEAVLSIYNYEVMHGTATFDVVPRTMEEQMDWFRHHDGDWHPVLVAVEDGRAVGFASLSSYRDRAAYDATAELSMYVDAAYRRRHCQGAFAGTVCRSQGARAYPHGDFRHRRGKHGEPCASQGIRVPRGWDVSRGRRKIRPASRYAPDAAHALKAEQVLLKEKPMEEGSAMKNPMGKGPWKLLRPWAYRCRI